MSVTDLALLCRGIILACLMIDAILAPLNAWEYLRRHRAPTERRERILAALKAVSIAVYGVAAFCGTYLRIDREFTPPLPFMAVGLIGYTVYLFMGGEAKKKSLDPVDETAGAPPLGISP